MGMQQHHHQEQYVVEHGLKLPLAHSSSSSSSTCVFSLTSGSTAGTVLQALWTSVSSSSGSHGGAEQQLGWRLMFGGRFLQEVRAKSL
jgi:hypothetical protein